MTDASRAAPITTAQQIAFCEQEAEKWDLEVCRASYNGYDTRRSKQQAKMYRSIAAALQPLLTTEDKVPAEDGAEGRD